MSYKVLLYEPMNAKGTDLLREKCELIYADSFQESDIISQSKAVDAIIIRANGKITRNIIESSPKLKVIGRHGVGLDTIDVEAASSAGVRVVNTPYANAQSVAEHFLGLAITLAKKLRLADMALRQGNWNARYELIGTELYGKTLGVLGFGKIGQQTARLCHVGLNMPLLYNDIQRFEKAEQDLNAQFVDIPTLFSNSDLITINLPLLSATRHMVNYELIRFMKPTAFLINMARGEVWVEADVLRALDEGLIGGAGSDVFDVEPAPSDNPLFSREMFVGSPHMSAHTQESMERMSMVAQDVLAVLEGREPEYPVN
ncbi:MAG: hydroxyacid dehydrogenase [Desulfohalobiaceae bacterium]|nr:hydroxyacid dehydrogenase [Desulfohalobiaceae bacterium]